MLLRIWRGRVRFGHVDQTRGTEVGVSGLVVGVSVTI
jgi:hypothetical protein